MNVELFQENESRAAARYSLLHASVWDKASSVDSRPTYLQKRWRWREFATATGMEMK